MKTTSLLFLASVAALATSASAAQVHSSSDVLVLPAYVVEAPRYQPAEQRINASLAELRQQAHGPIAVSVQLPLLQAQQVRHDRLAQAAAPALAARVAKF